MDHGSRTDPNALRTATEPRRLQILQLIWDRELSVGEIAARVPVSVAAVSQHLARLREAGLVRVRPEGRHRYYRAARRDMGTLAIVLESFWMERLDALKRLAESNERRGEDA
ncbi:MAG: metalloregulator ArsR/SmtB family transcription factor [Gemmatimonadota bacterium]|nr:metalloregulator ArsR/SmtB family transcription factor [Gemmatimonadota bacterium]